VQDRLSVNHLLLVKFGLDVYVSRAFGARKTCVVWVGQEDADVGHTCNMLIVKPEDKRPLERSRHGWEDNTKMILITVSSKICCTFSI
jgi:hypothetical protein